VKDQGVPSGYVEGLNDVRTLLADFSSILLGIDQIVLEGAHGRTLAFGPGRLESGSSAKDGGTMILTGHRDTHFQCLERLHGGETLLLQTRTGLWHRFTVRNGQIVDSRIASILTDEEGAHLILVTCYPFRTLTPNQPFRYVITADRESIADEVREED
jgi:sortase A